MKLKLSKRFSLKGFSLKKLILGNKDAVKIIVAAVVALVALDPASTEMFLVLGGEAVVASYILNVLHFFATEVEL
jgi:hypothetical protein